MTVTPLVVIAPGVPSQLQINGNDETPGMATKAVGRVTVSAVLNDPLSRQVRLQVFYSTNSKFQPQVAARSVLVASGHRATITLTGLGQNKHYFLRAFALTANGVRSDHGLPNNQGFNSADWWMNRAPLAPTLIAPAENATIPSNLPVTFQWNDHDPDPNDPQNGYEIRWRTSPGLGTPAGPWIVTSHPKAVTNTLTVDPKVFKDTTNYDWSVRTQDVSGLWGPWAPTRSWLSSGVTRPPRLIRPINDHTIVVDDAHTFEWAFRSPINGARQINADIRYRLVGQDDTAWITMLGATNPGVPGRNMFWDIPPFTFAPGRHFEWEMRTYDDQNDPPSDWTDPESFFTVSAPGGGNPIGDQGTDLAGGTLGCGIYRVFAFAQGGQIQRGEITDVSSLAFTRARDDISTATITVTGWNADCGELLRTLHSWVNEIVIYRNDQRVWEGPITAITYMVDSVTIAAGDVMTYMQRRVMREGFNDGYRMIRGVQTGLLTVVERAEQLLINALGAFDPNVLPYLTSFKFDTDARESRIVPDYSQTVWEQIDDLAAVAGLDYTVIGRRIMLWDTHRAIGRLPQMTDGDFGANVIVSEYGMQLCNFMVVTNGAGLYASTRPDNEPFLNAYYGPVEMIASAYGETGNTNSQAAQDQAVAAMHQQAHRNVSHRWPTPVTVRVPDNSTLDPDATVGFDQLVPGVWIPVLSNLTLRQVSQWQKLDLVQVSVAGDSPETVTVTMSPAPNGGQDPDTVDAMEATADLADGMALLIPGGDGWGADRFTAVNQAN